MNRPIKFRAKRVANDVGGRGGQWVYGEFAHDDIGNAFIHWFEKGNGWTHASIDESTLGQWTGLLDKNGKEIYEGDVLGYPNPIVKGVVTFGVYNNEQPYEDNVQGTGFYLKGTIGIRHLIQDRAGNVIGNIYENHELL